MRTSVALDADVAAGVRAIARQRGVRLGTLVNSMLRAALDAEQQQSTPYRLPTRSLGVREGIDVDRALAVADELGDTAVFEKHGRQVLASDGRSLNDDAVRALRVGDDRVG